MAVVQICIGIWIGVYAVNGLYRFVVVSGEYTIGLVSNYQDSRQQRENRRRTIVRVVCVVIAVAMLGSLVIPAIYAGL